MAAPSGIKWGNIITGNKSTRKGRIGIYAGVTTSASTVNVKIEVWFWSMYSIDDVYNSYYYNANASSATTYIGEINIDHRVATGEGWSTSNQTRLGSYSYKYDRGTSASTKNYAAKFTGIDVLGSSNVMSVSTSVTVPALSSYKVSYSANGGTGAPGSQTKWYGKTLKLSSTKPSRTGYSFQGWATSASGSVAYASGANYTANAAVTLYAVWKANTYTISFNANGGTGAPASQTKTYGVALTLSSTKPTRTNYNFQGWAMSPSGSVTYKAGGSYTANSGATLYAVWELGYAKPGITNLEVNRCESNGVISEDGAYASVNFNWTTDKTVSSIVIKYKLSGSSSWTTAKTLTPGGTSGSVSEIIGGSFDGDHSYNINVTVTDSLGNTPLDATLPGIKYPIDILKKGKGIAFNKPAELEGVADFNFQLRALAGIMHPVLESGTDLNTVLTPNTYIGKNTTTNEYANCPITSGTFTLEVVGAGPDGQIRQRLQACTKTAAMTYERYYYSSEFCEWYEAGSLKSSIMLTATGAADNRIPLETTKVYTKIPFDTVKTSIGGGLTMEDGCIKVGAGVRHVRLSANIKLTTQKVAGSRHARLCKDSGGTVTYHAWTNLYIDASLDTSLFAFTPVLIKVTEGDLLYAVFYTSESTDSLYVGTSSNGPQLYLTAESI